ncbi:MAG: hypothetical protein PHP22_09750, partial [Oscillospiraceae bacterium]|nr:hypothetical protein [Oscillospiraceae bacterium]
MQTTSEAFDTAIGSSSRELHCKLTIQTADLETYNLTSDDIIAGSLKVNRSLFLDGFELGTCFAADMSVSLKNLNGEWDGIDLEGATVWPYSGIRLPDTTIEYILLGTFIIDEPGRPDAELSIKAADRLVLLDKPFSGVSISWPATNYQILQAISTHCSVPLATSVSSALHMGYSVTASPVGDYSCRDIVEQICIMAAGFGRMSRIGEFEIGTLPDLTGETFEVNLTTANRFAFRQTSEPVTITGMTYKDIQETVQLGTEEYSLNIETLGILQANRDTVLAAIWSEISGYTYVGFESEYPGNPAIDVGDSIYQLTKDEREIVSLISGHNFVHGGSCKLTAVMRPKLAADWAAKNTKRLTAIAQKLDTTENTLTSFQQASAQMSDLLTIGLGLYRTEEVLEDGSAIQYMHNLPLLSESDVIWKQTALAWAYSTDGGTTWLGYDV